MRIDPGMYIHPQPVRNRDSPRYAVPPVLLTQPWTHVMCLVNRLSTRSLVGSSFS